MLALAACTVIAAPLHAQNANTIKPFRTQEVEAQRIDTNSFAEQINDRYVLFERRPSNPIDISPEWGEPNTLPFGNAQNFTRGSVGAQWPAVSATGWTPPDPDLAVGPNHIVAVVNSSIAFFDKDGTHTFQQTAQDFLSGLGAGTFLFDPKAFYDRVNSRFVVVFLERGSSNISKVIVAVSDDNNPSGTWFKYRIEARITVNTAHYWLDYPGFGYNKDAYVISGNMFGFSSGFAGAQFIVLPSAPLLTGSPATVHSLRDSGGASVQMAEVMDSSFDRIYGISRDGTSAMTVYCLRNLTSTPLLNQVNVTVPSNSRPTIDAPSTNGNTLDSLDGRTINAMWRGGSLLTSHTVQSNSRLRIRWYEIATNNWPISGSPSLTQSGEVAGATGVHHHMPAVAKNGVGDISVLFTRSSTSITADIMYAGRFANDSAGTMGAPVNLESSAGNDYTSNRWGDYFDVDVDPVDDVTFWGIAMGVALDNEPPHPWRTSVFSWTISQPGIAFAPTSMTMERGSLLAGNLAAVTASDDVRAEFRPGVTFTTSQAPIAVRFDATSPTLAPTFMQIKVESQASAGGILQTVEAFDYIANDWVAVDARNATVNADGTITLDLSTPARFVNGSGNVSARLQYRATGPVFVYPWTARVDQLGWKVSN
jgi:hypothetical protein